MERVATSKPLRDRDHLDIPTLRALIEEIDTAQSPAAPEPV